MRPMREQLGIPDQGEATARERFVSVAMNHPPGLLRSLMGVQSAGEGTLFADSGSKEQQEDRMTPNGQLLKRHLRDLRIKRLDDPDRGLLAWQSDRGDR